MANAGRVSTGGRELRCQHCTHAEFYHQTATLDRVALGGLLHFEGMWGQHTDIYVCARCGFAHFFIPVPATQESRPKPRPKPVPEEACLSCGKMIPPDATKCPACDWTWSDEKE